MTPTPVRCGKDHVEWDFAVVWVSPKSDPYQPATRMLFVFKEQSSQNTSLKASAKLVEQWTFVRGTCLRTFGTHEHEYLRAKQMACQVVATYRRNHLKKHGRPPHEFTLTAGVQYARPKLR